MALYRKSIQTEFGRFMIEANEIGISKVIFPKNAARFQDTPDCSKILEQAIRQLKNYFAREDYDFISLSYDFSETTDFQKKVLRILLSIPRKTLSYAELGELAGFPRSSRAVGTAMNKNPFPILIPCHRVIQADGKLGQYAFGTEWKKRLLSLETVAFAPQS